MSAFGKYFRSRREELGLSQREVAKRLRVSAGTISRWERGSAVPTPDRAGELRSLLGISVASVTRLIGGESPPAGAEVTEARIAELEDRIAELEQKCAEQVVELADAYGNSITLAPSGISITCPGQVEVNGMLVVSAPMVRFDTGMLRASGVVQADTVITNSVVSASYTPGAGNIW